MRSRATGAGDHDVGAGTGGLIQTGTALLEDLQNNTLTWLKPVFLDKIVNSSSLFSGLPSSSSQELGAMISHRGANNALPDRHAAFLAERQPTLQALRNVNSNGGFDDIEVTSGGEDLDHKSRNADARTGTDSHTSRGRGSSSSSTTTTFPFGSAIHQPAHPPALRRRLASMRRGCVVRKCNDFASQVEQMLHPDDNDSMKIGGIGGCMAQSPSSGASSSFRQQKLSGSTPQRSTPPQHSSMPPLQPWTNPRAEDVQAAVSTATIKATVWRAVGAQMNEDHLHLQAEQDYLVDAHNGGLLAASQPHAGPTTLHAPVQQDELQDGERNQVFAQDHAHGQSGDQQIARNSSSSTGPPAFYWPGSHAEHIQQEFAMLRQLVDQSLSTTTRTSNRVGRARSAERNNYEAEEQVEGAAFSAALVVLQQSGATSSTGPGERSTKKIIDVYTSVRDFREYLRFEQGFTQLGAY
ncbi:unnamed protein product [Amoebophrya sp. A25]|nr:unnamed protein product [Amoebophrya sp. A25]|eukprot:GSA25T00012123001.1